MAGASQAAKQFVLALDQGTTRSRSLVFDARGRIAGLAQREFTQFFPQPGWVEHDANEIWETQRATMLEALRAAKLGPRDIAAVGISNQRETVVLWDRRSGEPLARAIVWQDRRTAGDCERMRTAGLEPEIAARTGLLIDPYFSATKLAWLLDNIPGARSRAERGELAFGTVDSWLLFKLTGHRRHVTDATNASRTLLFNLREARWDERLLEIFRVPRACLPEVVDSCLSTADSIQIDLDGVELPVSGIAGDQQAALFGQACYAPGMVKTTYGTGCFALMHTGTQPQASRHRLLSTVALRRGGCQYALEGGVFMGGATVQWLRDGLGIIRNAAETGPLADKSDSMQSVYLVPAFVGMGAPYWNPNVRGALFGLTRNTGPAELAHAALESVCYQTYDLREAMRADWPGEKAANVLRVDGGMTASDWTMQRLADLLDAPVDRPVIQETTALGAAYLAGLQAGVYPEPQRFADNWRLEHRFKPAMSAATRERKLKGWARAVRGVLASDEG